MTTANCTQFLRGLYGTRKMGPNGTLVLRATEYLLLNSKYFKIKQGEFSPTGVFPLHVLFVHILLLRYALNHSLANALGT